MSAGATWRELRARRGHLPRVVEIPRLLPSPEGCWRLGLMSGGGELRWDPWALDPPHILVAGTTESGKTRLLELSALTASLLWGWRVTVIDFKGGGDYRAAVVNGAEVASEAKDAVAALVEAAAAITERNALLRDTPVILDGKDDRATTLRDLPLETRIRLGLAPWLIVIDETASIMARKKEGGPEALQAIVQLGRSAGVHVMLGMQRPDSSLLDGFVKHNVQARILLGGADPVTENMVLGSSVQAIDEEERQLPRPKGRGIASGVGGLTAVRFQAYLLRRSTYVPEPVGGVHSVSSGSDTPPVGGSDPPSSDARPRFSPEELRAMSAGLAGASFHRPPERDRSLVELALERDGRACCACGRDDLPFDVDHIVPLWAGGADSLENVWTLCEGCHAYKTAGEAPYLARARAGAHAASHGVSWRIPRIYPEWYVAAGLALAGLVHPDWWPWAAAVLLAYVLLPMLYRRLVPSWVRGRRRSRGGGINGYWEPEASREKKKRGFLGRTAKRVYGTMDVMTALKWGVGQAASVYLIAALTRLMLLG